MVQYDYKELPEGIFRKPKPEYNNILHSSGPYIKPSTLNPTLDVLKSRARGRHLAIAPSCSASDSWSSPTGSEVPTYLKEG